MRDDFAAATMSDNALQEGSWKIRMRTEQYEIDNEKASTWTIAILKYWLWTDSKCITAGTITPFIRDVLLSFCSEF